METVSRLSEQLEALGIPAPHWPDLAEKTGTSGTWIQQGLAYAEGIRLWQTQLVNAPESSRAVLARLLLHLRQSDQLAPWDELVIAMIGPEILQQWEWDRWDTLETLLDRLPLTAAQQLGTTLTLAKKQQIGLAATSLATLLRQSTSSEHLTEILTFFVMQADTNWHVREAEEDMTSWTRAVDLHQQLLRLLHQSLEHQQTDAALPTEDIIIGLQALFSTAATVDRWAGLPRAKSERLALRGEAQKAVDYLASALPAWLAQEERRAQARLLVCQLLVQQGRWQEAEQLHTTAVEGLFSESELISNSKTKLDILRIETQLLSSELSLALGNGSLKQTALQQPAQESNPDPDHWRALSRSQLGQDLWVLERLNWKREGFFVEFGATDGVLLSNSWLLEKHFGWRGICAEPNPDLFAKLQHNRACQVCPDCIYRHSGERMRFVLADAYGGLADFGQEDQHADKREAYAESGSVIEVVTTSLTDLLEKHNSPRTIDYLSIDTEGSEFAILEGIDWNRFQFRCITVEHNFTAQRKKIQSLLAEHGYQHQGAQWDDWYWKDLPI